MPVPRQPFQWRSCALTLDAPTAGWNVGRTAIRCVLSVVTPNATERNARGIAPRRSTIYEWPATPEDCIRRARPPAGSGRMDTRSGRSEWESADGSAPHPRREGTLRPFPGGTRKGEKIGLSRLAAARKVRTRILDGIFRGAT